MNVQLTQPHFFFLLFLFFFFLGPKTAPHARASLGGAAIPGQASRAPTAALPLRDQARIGPSPHPDSHTRLLGEPVSGDQSASHLCAILALPAANSASQNPLL